MAPTSADVQERFGETEELRERERETERERDRDPLSLVVVQVVAKSLRRN